MLVNISPAQVRYLKKLHLGKGCGVHKTPRNSQDEGLCC